MTFEWKMIFKRGPVTLDYFRILPQKKPSLQHKLCFCGKTLRKSIFFFSDLCSPSVSAKRRQRSNFRQQQSSFATESMLQTVNFPRHAYDTRYSLSYIRSRPSVTVPLQGREHQYLTSGPGGPGMPAGPLSPGLPLKIQMSIMRKLLKSLG